MARPTDRMLHRPLLHPKLRKHLQQASKLVFVCYPPDNCADKWHPKAPPREGLLHLETNSQLNLRLTVDAADFLNGLTRSGPTNLHAGMPVLACPAQKSPSSEGL